MLSTVSARAICLKVALKAADKGQWDNRVFHLMWDIIPTDMLLYLDYRKALSDPESSVFFRNVIRQAPLVLPLMAVLEEYGVLPLEPGSPHFQRYDLSNFSVEDEIVTVGPRMTVSCRELIKALNDKLIKPYSDVTIPDDEAQIVLPIMFKEMRLPFLVSVRRGTKLRIREFFANRVVHEIAESLMPPFSNPPISLNEPFEPTAYSLAYTARLRGPVVPSVVSLVYDYLGQNPNPPRGHNYRDELLEEVYSALPASIRPQHTAPASPTAPTDSTTPTTDAPASTAPIPAAHSPTPTTQNDDTSQHDAATGVATTEHSQGFITDNERESHERTDDRGVEDDEPPVRIDDVAPNQEGQNPDDAPDPTSHGTISANPSQANSETNSETNLEANSEASSEADSEEDSETDSETNSDADSEANSAGPSDLTTNRGRKRGAEEAEQEQQESTTPNPKRLPSAEEIQAISKAVCEINAKLDAANIQDIASASRANAVAMVDLRAQVEELKAEGVRKAEVEDRFYHEMTELAKLCERTRNNANNGPEGEDSAGAIPRPVVREAEVKQDDKEARDRGLRNVKLVTPISVLLFSLAALGCIQGVRTFFTEPPSANSAVLVQPANSLDTPRINCEAGYEEAAAFCKESECIKSVANFCSIKIMNGVNLLKDDDTDRAILAQENEIIQKFM